MAIRFRCQHCTGLMSIASRKAGMQVPCATCGRQTLVPLQDILDAAVPAVSVVNEPPAAAVNPPAPNVVAAKPIDFEIPPPEAVAPHDEALASHLQSDYAIESLGSDEIAPIADGSPDEPEEAADEWPEAESDETDDDAAMPLTLSRRERIDDEMDLTPMVDVTFQLLIFFMVTASFALQKSIQVPTPDPNQKGATQQMQTLDDLQGTSILVKIDAANAILIDDGPLADPAQLTEVLRDKMRKEQKTELLVTAHSAALHRGVIAVIDAANEVGMQKIRLASRKGKDE